MLGLMISTILTSAADSLNPIAITQQFVLQGMVRKPQHIWYFILSIAMTNLASGYLAYYGLIAFLGSFAEKIIVGLGKNLFAAELMLGIVFLILCCWLVQNQSIQKLKLQLRSSSEETNLPSAEEAAAKKIKSVSPSALVVLGIAATISELLTALPYFAFLGILFQYQLSLGEVTGLLVVYNVIYSLPLIVLYIVYMRARDQFDRLYLWMKLKMSKISEGIAPAAVGLIGSFLVVHSLSILIR
jgi:hypothetical protein